MAYDSETNKVLSGKARAALNIAENSLQAAMRRLDELERRYAIETPPIAPPPPPVAGFADFNFTDWVEAGGHHTTSGTEGAFRFTANIAKMGRFDPLVYPGQDNVGHLHQFWGNKDIGPHSTHESLTRSGHSSGQGDMINRSAYWTPVLLFGDTAWLPDFISNYYKLVPNATTRELPAGLRFIFGKAMDGKGGGVQYTLHGADLPNGRISSPNPADVLPHMKSGHKFDISVTAPNLWNGQISATDHRSHLAYPIWNGQIGKWETPETHPYTIPTLTVICNWTVPEGVDLTTLRSSSDMPGQYPLWNWHADYMEAWHPVARKAWHENALLRKLNCSACDFGNGQKGKEPVGFSFEQRPNLIPMAHADTGHVH